MEYIDILTNECLTSYNNIFSTSYLNIIQTIKIL